jgi:hypothetical protein
MAIRFIAAVLFLYGRNWIEKKMIPELPAAKDFPPLGGRRAIRHRIISSLRFFSIRFCHPPGPSGEGEKPGKWFFCGELVSHVRVLPEARYFRELPVLPPSGYLLHFLESI